MKFTKILILFSILFLTSCSSDKKTAELSFGTMQFKIVLNSTNSSRVPLLKDFRAIALA